jgi:hypothetical protein
MFFEEARISASLNHPNIVQIYEVGGDEQDCFLAMEFLRGRSYAHLQRLASVEPADYRVDLEVLLATLAGLEHAHQRRDLAGEPMCLVHRDVSPPNVIVTYDGEIKVLDFGVAKSKDSLVKTEAGTLKGKVAYMAPEVVAGDPFDARADLYAVGVMLWEATAARDRWPRMSDVAILAHLARGGAVESPDAAARGLPLLANDICIKALAEDPAKRYQTAADFREALLELCDELGGRLGQLELKAYMQQHFGADRAREEREVEAALRAQRITPGGSLSEAEVGGFTKQVRRAHGEQPKVDSVPPPASAPESSKGRGKLWLVVAGIALGGVALTKLLSSGGVLFAGKGDEHGADKPALAAAASAVAPSPLPASAAQAGEPQPASGVVTQKSGAVVHERVPRPAKHVAQAPAPVPKPTAQPRGLQVDRQDPWKE